MLSLSYLHLQIAKRGGWKSGLRAAALSYKTNREQTDYTQRISQRIFRSVKSIQTRVSRQVPRNGLLGWWDSRPSQIPRTGGGLNGSLQHSLAVYWPESQPPKSFEDVDLTAARLCRVQLVYSRPFREVLSQQPVRVFVRAALPRAVRITKVHFHIRGHCEGLVFGHLQPAGPPSTSAAGMRRSTAAPRRVPKPTPLCINAEKLQKITRAGCEIPRKAVAENCSSEHDNYVPIFYSLPRGRRSISYRGSSRFLLD